MTFVRMLTACAVAVTIAGGASAATLKLDGYTSSVKSVSIGASPVSGTPSNVGATGFKITDTSTSLGSFTAWCLDIAHYMMGVGATQEYSVTTNPFSNSFGLSTVAKGRVQSVFDANYASVDATNGNQAAAFQMALWEAAFEGDGNALSVTYGQFRAASTGSTDLANTYLTNAKNYAGGNIYSLTFLETDGYDASRGKYTGQNLVTASLAPVPLPAGGVLLASALIGAGVVRRRRR